MTQSANLPGVSLNHNETVLPGTINHNETVLPALGPINHNETVLPGQTHQHNETVLPAAPEPAAAEDDRGR